MNTTCGTDAASAHAARGLARDGVSDEPPLALPLVRQQRPAVDVAARIQPLAVHGRHAELVVDVQRAFRGDPDRLEPDPLGAGGPSRGDEELVAHELAAVVESERDRPVGRVRGREKDRAACQDADAFRVQRLREHPAHPRLEPAREPVGTSDDRHLARPVSAVRPARTPRRSASGC